MHITALLWLSSLMDSYHWRTRVSRSYQRIGPASLGFNCCVRFVFFVSQLGIAFAFCVYFLSTAVSLVVGTMDCFLSGSTCLLNDRLCVCRVWYQAPRSRSLYDSNTMSRTSYIWFYCTILLTELSTLSFYAPSKFDARYFRILPSCL